MPGLTTLDDSSDPDALLVDEAASGDFVSFEMLVRRHRSALFGFAFASLREPEEAAEAVQDTFVSAWRSLPSYRGDSAVSTWLHGICSHKILDAHRSRSRRHEPVDIHLLDKAAHPVDEDIPFRSAVDTQFVVELERALDDLPLRQRSAWVLREIHAATYPDIGRQLNISATAARGQRHRATAALAQRLSEWQRT